MRTMVGLVLHAIRRSPGFSLLVVAFLGLAVAAGRGITVIAPFVPTAPIAPTEALADD